MQPSGFRKFSHGGEKPLMATPHGNHARSCSNCEARHACWQLCGGCNKCLLRARGCSLASVTCFAEAALRTCGGAGADFIILGCAASWLSITVRAEMSQKAPTQNPACADVSRCSQCLPGGQWVPDNAWHAARQRPCAPRLL